MKRYSVTQLVNAMNYLGDMTVTLARNLIIMTVVPILLLALYVEQSRVQHGIELFEPDPRLAPLAGWMIVLANLLNELIIHYIYQVNNYHPPPPEKFTLRKFAMRVLQFIGINPYGRWTPEVKGPAHRWESIRSMITFTILFLAMAGSLGTLFEDIDNIPWYQGLWHILTKSDFNSFILVISGLIYALAVVLVSQSLAMYVSRRAVQFAAEILELELVEERGETYVSDDTSDPMWQAILTLEGLIDENNWPKSGQKTWDQVTVDAGEMMWRDLRQQENWRGPYKTPKKMVSSMKQSIRSRH